MAIIATQPVAAPIEEAGGGDVTVTETADPTPDGEGAPVIGDLDIIAEIEAAQQGGPGPDGAHNPDQAGSTPAPATDPAEPATEKPKPDEPAEPPATPGESGDVRKARQILAAANRKLARANQVRDQVRAELVNNLRSKPLETLRELGTSIGELLDADTGEAPAAAPATTEDRVTKLERELAEERTAKQQAQTQAEIDRLSRGIHDQIRTSKDFPRINAANKGQGAHSLVTDLMIEYHGTHGKPLPAARAAAIVEDFLSELAGATAPAPQPSPAPSSAAPSKGQPTPKRQGSQTLDNTETRNVGPGTDDLPQDLDERVAAVMREMGLGLNH